MKTTWMWMGVGIALCMTACSGGSPATADDRAGTSPVSPAERGGDVLPTSPYQQAARALADGRMLSPAGDNAVEHYLAARAGQPDQARAQAALAELQPYVLIAAEQAIAHGDAREAARLQSMIERIDAQAPALPRLRAEVTTLLREQAAHVAIAAEPSPTAAPAAMAARVAAPSVPASPLATVVSTVPEPPPAALPPPAPMALEETKLASVPAAAPRVAKDAHVPRLVRDAQPRYPLPALRARIEGQAEVAFTVQPDGSVRDVRLLSSTPAGMFDASALAVAQRWRFEATGQAHASSRTVRFRLPDGNAGGG